MKGVPRRQDVPHAGVRPASVRQAGQIAEAKTVLPELAKFAEPVLHEYYGDSKPFAITFLLSFFAAAGVFIRQVIMRYTQLAHAPGMNVSVIALGTMSVASGSMHAHVDQQQAADTIRAALDAGINFIDTAPAYGNGESEQRLGSALADLGTERDRVVLATKASGPTLSRDEILSDCEASLQRLQTDYIDLYQIHWRRDAVPLSESMDALQTLKQQGKVRAIGVCNFGPADLAEADMAGNRIVSNQVAYSLLTRSAEFELTGVCAKHGLGMLCYSPLAQGLLTGKYKTADELPPDRCRSRHFAGTRAGSRHGEDGLEAELFAAIESLRNIADEHGMTMSTLAVAWLLHQPAVASVLCGASTPEQATANAAAADVSLAPDVLEKLDAATAAVKAKLGPNMDMWQGAAASRIH